MVFQRIVIEENHSYAPWWGRAVILPVFIIAREAYSKDGHQPGWPGIGPL